MATLEDIDDLRVNPYRIFQNTLDYTASLGGQALSAECIASGYDWSGYSPRQLSNFIRSGQTEPEGLTWGRPCTLISEHYAIGAYHMCPIGGTICYFKAPDGSEKSATVTSIQQFSIDTSLIYFETPPDVSLKRYPIGTNTRQLSYYEIYSPELDGGLRMMQLILGSAHNYVYYRGTDWTPIPPYFVNGSGMPCMIGVDGELVFLGSLYTSYVFSSPAYLVLEDIQAAIAPDTLTTIELPATDRPKIGPKRLLLGN